MQFKQAHNDPQNYYWFKHGFSGEELEKIYKDVAKVPLQEATIIGNANTDEIKQIRSSSVKWIPKSKQWQWLYDKMMAMATEANDALWHFDLISADEQIQFTEYYDTADGHYDWHQDIGPGNASLRKVSITIQLSDSDEYEGGDLQFWQGAAAVLDAPRGAGVAVIFPSYLMHRVTKVTKGTRRSFVLWVGGQHYK
jgi:PKHD-type hydroxylase